MTWSEPLFSLGSCALFACDCSTLTFTDKLSNPCRLDICYNTQRGGSDCQSSEHAEVNLCVKEPCPLRAVPRKPLTKPLPELCGRTVAKRCVVQARRGTAPHKFTSYLMAHFLPPSCLTATQRPDHPVLPTRATIKSTSCEQQWKHLRASSRRRRTTCVHSKLHPAESDCLDARNTVQNNIGDVNVFD